MLVLPNLVKFCEICDNREHIRWIKNTVMRLQEQIPFDDTISHHVSVTVALHQVTREDCYLMLFFSFSFSSCSDADIVHHLFAVQDTIDSGALVCGTLASVLNYIDLSEEYTHLHSERHSSWSLVFAGVLLENKYDLGKIE